MLSALLTALRDCAGGSGLPPHCKAAAVVAKQGALAQHRHIRFPAGCVSPVDARYRIAQSRASGHHHRPHLLKPGRRKAWRYASGIGHDRRPPCPKRHPCRLRQPTATQRSFSSTEAAKADITLLQSRQRSAPANGCQKETCPNRVVTTRRKPVVTTRMLPQQNSAKPQPAASDGPK